MTLYERYVLWRQGYCIKHLEKKQTRQGYKRNNTWPAGMEMIDYISWRIGKEICAYCLHDKVSKKQVKKDAKEHKALVIVEKYF